MDHKQGKKDKTERATGVGRRTREEMKKVESHDSPQIPGRKETSDIHGLPSRLAYMRKELVVML